MQQYFQYTLYSYAILNAISLIFAVVFYLGNKGVLAYRYNVFYWIANFVLFCAQGLGNSSDGLIILSFSTAIFLVISIGFLFEQIFLVTLNHKLLWKVLVAGAVVSNVLSLFKVNFTLASLPVSFAVAGSLLAIVFKTIQQKNFRDLSGTTLLFMIIITSCGVHFADFPFLRKIESAAMFGFLFAFFYGVFMSVLLPYLIAEQTLRSYANRLEKEVADKTIALKESALHLEDLALERQSLVRLICHDSNNHLTVQRFALQKLQEMFASSSLASESSKTKKFLDKIAIATERQISLTRSVSVMSALESGKVSTCLKECNLVDLIQRSLSDLEYNIKGKDIKIKLQCSDNLKVLADETLLPDSLFSNLLSNAIKFSLKGGTIYIRAQVNHTENFVRVVFRDGGVGIPNSTLMNLFSPTKKTNRMGTGGESGTGFGMQLAFSTVKLHNGEIKIKSKTKEDSPDNHYTLIAIYLPLLNQNKSVVEEVSLRAG